MLFSMMPLSAPVVSADEGRDASIMLTVNPSAQNVNPGESGEYTVRVYNQGSTAVTVQLSTAEKGLKNVAHIPPLLLKLVAQ